MSHSESAQQQGDTGHSYLVVRDLTKKFGDFTALKDISLEVIEGEFLCFLGPSGCGKTTLLRAIAGLDIQTFGEIHQGGREISTLPPSERDFGIVFQSYALFPNLSVRKNVAYGLENRGMSRADIDARVNELLETVGLPEQGAKYPAQLSGGQQQRVALARALAPSPGLLLLDEPLSALDAKVRVHLRHQIKALQNQLGITTIMVTHDQEEALTMADRIVVMNHGVIEQIGTPEEIYREPASAFVADFIGQMNFAPGTMAEHGKVKLGTVELSCKANGFAPGSEVTLAVRPEDIRFDPSANEGSNAFKVRVTEIEFLGSFFRATLESPGLGTVRLVADLPINTARRLDIREGYEVSATIPPEFIRLYEGGGWSD